MARCHNGLDASRDCPLALAVAAPATTAADSVPADRASRTALRTAAHEVVTGSSWCETLRSQGTAAALEQLGNRQRTLRRMGCALDDLTVLALGVASADVGG